MHRPRRWLVLLIVLVMGINPGCVRRTIRITSDPSGALVWLNDREVGRTPVDVEFVYYGDYAVRLVKEGYEPLLTSGEAEAPLWDLPGPDLVAEVTPAEFHSRVHWHYTLEAAVEDRSALLDRAGELREAAGPPAESAP